MHLVLKQIVFIFSLGTHPSSYANNIFANNVFDWLISLGNKLDMLKVLDIFYSLSMIVIVQFPLCKLGVTDQAFLPH